MSKLLSPLTIRGITLPNRVVVSPLCMYSAVDGMAQPWHFAHLSTFARGKAGLVFAEATAVETIGRITPQCLGIWSDEQAEALKPITQFITDMGCIAGIQLAHAGRKASTSSPFAGGGKPLDSDDPQAWQVVGPSAVPVADNFQIPRELSKEDLAALTQAFVAAAKRSLAAGFEVIEVHGAHGYLLHSFLSPLANFRTDEYGGSLENRMRFPLQVTSAIREAIGDSIPLFFRISAIDGPTEGWSMDDSVALSNELAKCGVDVVDCSSGGIGGAPRFRIDDTGKPLTKSSARTPGFQVPFADRIQNETPLKSMAVGVIIEPQQAEDILASGKAELVALGREIMHDPFWPLRAGLELGDDPDYEMWPPQYKWAVDRRAQIALQNKS